MDVKPVPQGIMPTSRSENRALLASARELEATFLAEMLKHGGLNASPDGFGGGAGEEAFSSYLTGEYARLLADRGGIGLAEQIFQALAAREE